MANAFTGDVRRHLRHLFEAGSAVGLTDGQLLERFATTDSDSAESAFETILTRHGSTVLTVCRQVLGDAHAAEDAFQATFLVLIRRAGSLRLRENGSLGPWLYGVAYRTALKARQSTFRRHAREHRAAVPETRAGEGAATVERDDLGAALHEEINRLPARYRAPIVLCYFEGRTHDEAAAALRWPVGTVRSYLSRARDRLRSRLTRRGLAPAGWIRAASIETVARAEVPAALRNATIAAAIRGTPAATVATLANLMLRSLLMTRVKLAAATLCTVLIVVSLGYALSGAPGSQPPNPSDPRSSRIAATPTQPQPRLRASWKEKDARVEVFSPDARYVVSSGGEGCRLRDTATGRVRAVLTTGPQQLHGALFSPDGRFLFAKVGSDRYKPVWTYDLKVWAIAGGELYATFPYISDGINVHTHDFAVSGDGKAFAFLDHSERLPMKVESGKIMVNRNEYDITFNLNPGLPRVRLWDMPHWKETAILDGGSHMVFSPDGKTLITGPRDWKDPVARVWDVGTGRLRAEFDSGAPWVKPLTFSPDGKYLAIGNSKKQVLRELSSGREWSVAAPYPGNNAPRFRKDGRLLLPSGFPNVDGRLLFPNGMLDTAVPADQGKGYACYDLATLPPRGLALEPGERVIAPDVSRYATVLSRGGMWGSASVVLHDLPSSRESGHIEIPGLIGAGFSPDGRRLALLSGRNAATTPGSETRYVLEIRLLDPTTARVLVTIPSPGETWGNYGWTFSPDGRYLAIHHRTGSNISRPGDAEPNERPMNLDIWEIPY